MVRNRSTSKSFNENIDYTIDKDFDEIQVNLMILILIQFI
jgi:hypothetical protein